MSFLTPTRLQDASRILRGVALVAAKAAADSPLLRRAGQGDLNNALQEALKSASQQTKQMAEVLNAASKEQTGATMQQHLQKGQDAARSVASAFQDRAEGTIQEGQEATNRPEAIMESIFDQAKRSVEHASKNAREAAESLSQDVPAILQNIAKQGQQTAQQMLTQTEQGLEQAVRQGQDMAASGMTQSQQAAEQALYQPDLTAATALEHDIGISPGPSSSLVSTFSQARGSKTSLVLNFSGGSGTATAGLGSNYTVGSPPLPSSPPQGLSGSGDLYIQSEGQSLTVSDSAKPDPASSRSQAEPLAGSAALGSVPPTVPDDAAASATDSAVSARQAALDATEVLRSHSSSRELSAAGSGLSNEPAQPGNGLQGEAAVLVEEERRLSLKEAIASGTEKAQIQAKKEEVKRQLRERRVPSSPIGRVAGFAQLGASLVYGTVADQVSSYFRGGQQEQGGNPYLTERNAERLADALCRMRGAALKLGQMISIQDENVLPPQLSAALERVRAGADVMPRKQLHKVLVDELGAEWRTKVASFEDEPLAAASIGQVHGATLHDGRRVVLKIQYPGVARSIESDVDNLLRIISLANILPKGMYIENAAKVAKKELKMECDYGYEARCQTRFVQLIADDADFKEVMHVPAVVPELSSNSVLCSEWVPGVHIDKVAQMSQPVRDAVGTLLLQLTLRELFDWRFMQTDPNWGNFLYDEAGGQLHLIDFGAAREFPVGFVDDYLNMVRACAEKDRQGVIDCSTRLGFLTGDESKVMLDAHSEAGFVVGTPFSSPGLYDFAHHNSLTKQVSQLGAVMLKHRLTPPPEDSYSLHRKLSGAFLACIKLRARVPCRELFYAAYDHHQWGQQGVTAEELPDLELASG